MRKPLPVRLAERRLELQRLETAWVFHNKPRTDQGLKESMSTKLTELRAIIADLEAQTGSVTAAAA